MRQKRDRLPKDRHAVASQKAFNTLKLQAAGKKFVLSYTTFQSELCLEELNQWLARQGSLVLPTVHGTHLRLFHVKNLSTELTISPWGIAEPNPKFCTEVQPEDIDFALIPALAFDQSCHRLGYGKGYYDRLLSLCQTSLSTVGVGFHEQLLSPKLPVDMHDQSLSTLALF